jgi:CBS domain-containing membrane protein
MRHVSEALRAFLGIGGNQTSHREKLVSGLGGFVSIFCILIITRHYVGDGAGLIVASMGASAVLLFAVPHGPLSQPWALIGGHLVSSLIGVTCYLLISDTFVAAAAAVGLAITAMYYLRCIHPPGGATALTAVAAGAGVHALGYRYVITPVMINVAVILSVAIVFNFMFAWRRYPVSLMQYRNKTRVTPPVGEQLSREDLEYALKQMNLYVDVGNAELEKIYQLARNRIKTALSAPQIQLGHYYSNGEYGSNWSVRQVVDESTDREQVIYKVVAGQGRRNSGTLSRDEFAQWAKYEVYLNENSWQRVASSAEYDRAA